MRAVVTPTGCGCGGEHVTLAGGPYDGMDVAILPGVEVVLIAPDPEVEDRDGVVVIKITPPCEYVVDRGEA